MFDEPREPSTDLPISGSPIAAGPVPKRATHAATPPPPVKVEIYEGPLDLLLDLIRKQQINIYDIPVAKITRQYLDYLQRATELDIELSSDFVFMAATLI